VGELVGEAVKAAGGGGTPLQAMPDDAAGLGLVAGDVADGAARVPMRP
jgi:hypothetical protein